MMGLRKKEHGKSQICHKAYYDNMKASQNWILVIENVPEYEERVVHRALGNKDWKLESVRIDPRVLGFGASRARLYIVAYRQDKLDWVGPWTLTSFVEILRARVKMTAHNYFWMQLPKSKLTPSNETQMHFDFVVKRTRPIFRSQVDQEGHLQSQNPVLHSSLG